ncbi:MAG: methyltransferase [Canibacter sp.]
MSIEKNVSVLPITEKDLEWWQNKLVKLDWVFAVTYAEGAPHEYIAERTEGIAKADFVRAARVIHTFGEPQKFYKSTRIYLVHDGWKYWTMDREHDDVTLINRGRADHIYGPQNMPRTKSEFRSGYDAIATYWDRDFTASDEEQRGFTRLVDVATDGYRKCRTLDIGAGTGLTLDLGLTEAPRLTAIDPSQAMLNELVRKHPLVARVEPRTFADTLARRTLAGTQFDLVLALGGSASYLSHDDWESIMRHARGRLVLSAYAEGEAPVTADLTSQQLADANSRLRECADRHEGRIERVGRFDTVAIGRNHS